jgi:hypothetical protein
MPHFPTPAYIVMRRFPLKASSNQTDHVKNIDDESKIGHPLASLDNNRWTSTHC